MRGPAHVLCSFFFNLFPQSLCLQNEGAASPGSALGPSGALAGSLQPPRRAHPQPRAWSGSKLSWDPQYPAQRQGFNKPFLSHPEPRTCTEAVHTAAHGNSITCALPSPLLISPPFSEHPPSPSGLYLPASWGGPEPFPPSALALSVLGLCRATGMHLPSPPPAPRSGPLDSFSTDLLCARLPRAILWYCRGGIFFLISCALLSE